MKTVNKILADVEMDNYLSESTHFWTTFVTLPATSDNFHRRSITQIFGSLENYSIGKSEFQHIVNRKSTIVNSFIVNLKSEIQQIYNRKSTIVNNFIVNLKSEIQQIYNRKSTIVNNFIVNLKSKIVNNFVDSLLITFLEIICNIQKIGYSLSLSLSLSSGTVPPAL